MLCLHMHYYDVCAFEWPLFLYTCIRWSIKVVVQSKRTGAIPYESVISWYPYWQQQPKQQIPCSAPCPIFMTCITFLLALIFSRHIHSKSLQARSVSRIVVLTLAIEQSWHGTVLYRLIETYLDILRVKHTDATSNTQRIERVHTARPSQERLCFWQQPALLRFKVKLSRVSPRSTRRSNVRLGRDETLWYECISSETSWNGWISPENGIMLLKA